MTALSLRRSRRTVAASGVFLATILLASSGCAAGLDIHADADAAQVGLPAYPGAVKKTDHGDHDHEGDNAAFSFGVWGKTFGFQLAVVNYRSPDSVDAVAAFYRDALAKYGPVLDCSHNVKKPDGSRKHGDGDDSNKPVTCDNDTVAAGGRLFKVGTNQSQHVVKVTPWHDGADFELVHVDAHGSAD